MVEQCQFGIEDFSERLMFSKVTVTGGINEKSKNFYESALIAVSKSRVRDSSQICHRYSRAVSPRHHLRA
ncbi:hypothetical protein, partial [Sodalis-like endosymbiont of Proechinophthirus fluctus]|uniref:hypothetical protein n=1 Tax=Sodalis-like endosymbiont of Proechinophthirus fluctus TaxID=1462730 RepID=UPI00195B2CBB